MRSKLAVWSFILSLIPYLFLVFFLAFRVIWNNFLQGFSDSIFEVIFLVYIYLSVAMFPIALILGIISLYKMRRYKLKGRWFAIAGIFISFLDLLVPGLSIS